MANRRSRRGQAEGRRGHRPAVEATPPVAGSAVLPGRSRAAVAVAAAIAAGALYLLTLAPSAPPGDSGELMAVAFSLGVAHPPGYPTFTVLTHLAGLVTPGNPALGMNGLSAVLDAGAVALVGLAIVGLANRARLADAPSSGAVIVAGLGGAWLLAVSPVFWLYSTGAEVFALANLLAVAVLGLTIWWWLTPSRVGRLWAAAFLSGLAMTNQQTFVFLAPGLLVLYVSGWRRLVAPLRQAETGGAFLKAVIVPLGFAALGLLPYLYLPLAAAADPPVVWGDPTSAEGLLAILLRRDYGTFVLTARETVASPLDHLAVFAGSFWNAFTPLGLAAAAVGFIALARRAPTVAWALGLSFLVAGPGFVLLANAPVEDPIVRGIIERFFLLPSIPLAIVAGVGLVAVAGWLSGQVIRGRPIGGRLGTAIVGLAIGAVLASGLVVRYPDVDRSADLVAERYARDVLDPLARDAVLLMRGDENDTSIVYAQVVLGLRPDVAAVDVELLKAPAYVDRQRRLQPGLAIPWRNYDDRVDGALAELISANLGRRPVYRVGLVREDLSARFTESRSGLAIELSIGGAFDLDAAARAGQAFFSLHPPDRPWPDTSWEQVIAADYADLAFDLAVRLQEGGPGADAALAERLYREAVRLTPARSSAYKNLGLLLRDHGGQTSEIIRLWTRYLELAPDDAEAPAIRAELDRLEQLESVPGSPPPFAP